jgi:hypothetical protein
MSPLFSTSIKIYNGGNFINETFSLSELTYLQPLNYETIFYGRGRGIHSTTPFHGYLLKELLQPYFKSTPEMLRSGYFVVASVDGYRCVYSFSEIFNRNDQAEVLLIEDPENQDGGVFRFFPAGDFFSDRAIKAVSEIRLLQE